MKKIILLFFLIALTISAFSQAYKPMLKENKTWEDFHHQFNQIPFPQYTYQHEIFYIDGDTLINNIKKFIQMTLPI
jgi:hypothetical protein